MFMSYGYGYWELPKSAALVFYLSFHLSLFLSFHLAPSRFRICFRFSVNGTWDEILYFGKASFSMLGALCMTFFRDILFLSFFS
jgi:hypothetical protein